MHNQSYREQRGGVLGEGAASPSPPAMGVGERCMLPQPPSGFTTFEVLAKTLPNTSVVLLLLTTGSHIQECS